MNIKCISYLTLYNKCTWTRLGTGGVNMMNMSRRSVDELGRLVHSGTEVQMTRGPHRQIQGLSALYIGGAESSGSTMEVITYSEVSQVQQWRCGKLGVNNGGAERGSIMEVITYLEVSAVQQWRCGKFGSRISSSTHLQTRCKSDTRR